MSAPQDDDLDRWFAGGSPPEGFAERLAADRGLRRRLVRRAVFEAMLRAAAKGARPRTGGRLPAAPRWAWAAAAILAVAIGAAAWLGMPAADAPYRIIAGQVTVDGRAGPILPGALVASVGAQPAHIRLPDGSRAVLTPGSAAMFRSGGADLPGVREDVRLLAGQGRFSIVPGGVPVQVRTEAGTVIVLGTEFQVACDPSMAQAMTVNVTRGKVRVDHGGGSQLLVAGDRQRFERGRPHPRLRRGRLIAIAADAAERPSLTISTSERQELAVHPLAPAAEVLRDGKPAALADLVDGEPVELSLIDDQVVKVAGLGPQVAGIVRGFDPVDRSIDLLVGGRDGARFDHHRIAADVAVRTKSGRPADLAAVVPGAAVRVRLSFDLSQVVEIELARDPAQR